MSQHFSRIASEAIENRRLASRVGALFLNAVWVTPGCYTMSAAAAGSTPGWVSITKGGVEIETDTLSNRSKPKHLRNKLGPAWAYGPEDRSNIETEIPG